MTIQEIINKIKERYDGLVVNRNWGELGLFYNPDNLLPKGIYLLTFKEKDGPNDKSSNTNRNGVFRLNIGISKESFMDTFGYIPKRPKAGQTIDMPYDYTEINKLMPHPVYGWMCWIGILNPDKNTFNKISPFIEEGYQLAKFKYEKKIKKLREKEK